MNYENFPHYWVNHLGFQLRKELETAFVANGHRVTSEEWALLLILSKHGQLSPRDLSQLTLRDPTTVSRLIDRLEGKGLIERTRTRKDRRIVDVGITETGRALFAKLADIASRLIDLSLQGIAPQDLERVNQVLKKMSENLTNLERGTDV